jgi:hypothetical protein
VRYFYLLSWLVASPGHMVYRSVNGIYEPACTDTTSSAFAVLRRQFAVPEDAVILAFDLKPDGLLSAPWDRAASQEAV